MIDKPTVRRWAVIAPAQSGKSTFVASNARPPIFVVDSDNNFDHVAGLAQGKVIKAPRRVVVDTYLLDDELIKAAYDLEAGTFVFDSVTQLYSTRARRATMGARMNQGERERRGLGKNKAADMVHKADVVAVMTNARGYGPDVFYVWHRSPRGDAKGNLEVREEISDIERGRIMAAVDVVIHLSAERGQYGIWVESARDFGGKPANSGFTVTDFPGNYWRGGIDRLENMIYVAWTGQEQALKWAAEKLGRTAESLLDLYGDVKDRARPKNARAMWIAWIDAIYNLEWEQAQKAESNGANGHVEEPAVVVEQPKVETAVQPEQPPAPETPPMEAPPTDEDFEDMFPKHGPVPEPVPEPGKTYKYRDGNEVAEVDVIDFLKFKQKHGREPFEQKQLYAAVSYAQERGGW